MNQTLAQVLRAIDHIESALFEDIPLAELAQSVGASPWHFQRVFTGMTGETPASYARKRRLAQVCERLVQSDLPLAQLALECGFESQTAFTRAFSRQVGLSPARYRRMLREPTPDNPRFDRASLQCAHRYPRLDAAVLTARNHEDPMEPKIEQRAVFHVIGLSGQVTPAQSTRIPEIWSRFGPRMHEVPKRVGQRTYGICLENNGAPADDCSFTYVAGVEVSHIDHVPDGMVAVSMPANTYAVFTHRGHVSQIKDTFARALAHWLPAANYHHVAAPDFEQYDERFDPQAAAGEIDLYLPVARA